MPSSSTVSPSRTLTTRPVNRSCLRFLQAIELTLPLYRPPRPVAQPVRSRSPSPPPLQLPSQHRAVLARSVGLRVHRHLEPLGAVRCLCGGRRRRLHAARGRHRGRVRQRCVEIYVLRKVCLLTVFACVRLNGTAQAPASSVRRLALASMALITDNIPPTVTETCEDGFKLVSGRCH